MKAAVFHSADRPLEVEDVPDPTPGPTDLVVEVRCCGICGSDLQAASQPGGLPQGCVMGHEFSGEVVEVGAEVGGQFSPGDRVTAVPGIGCGTCADCLSGDVMHCAALKITGLGQLPGAYAQYVRVGSNESVRLPESVDFPLGALVEPLAVGLHAVKAAGLEPGQDVLVLGAGPIGLAVILWSRFLGARDILVSEPAEGRRAMATALGATAVAPGTDAAAEILAERPRGGADITFECVGKPGLLAQSVKIAAPRSKVVVAGLCMRPDNFVPGVAVVKELRLEFVLAYHKADFQLTLDMLDAGRIDPWPMVTDRIDLPGLPQAFEALKKPADECKVLVEF
ncbi:MAG: alcohol dehydrogenase catalytic domain-containing protein [Myxococcota bacterium]|nr:alcohol dehydrogenase catalytic domain-containing protein [Myxococcota bacterium]